MNADNPEILEILERCMVARIATVSRNGRPNVNPLYFIYLDRKIWLGTAEWTLAARNVKADPRASVLFEMEKGAGAHLMLRVSGHARVRLDAEAIRAYSPRVVRKYILTIGGIWNMLTHLRQLWLRRFYSAQSAQKGQTCIIEVVPEQMELLASN